LSHMAVLFILWVSSSSYNKYLSFLGSCVFLSAAARSIIILHYPIPGSTRILLQDYKVNINPNYVYI